MNLANLKAKHPYYCQHGNFFSNGMVHNYDSWESFKAEFGDADDDMNLQAASRLIEGDMALAAAVMKAVNSSLYGLKGRVQSVQQAITYLGMREVAAITFEMGLRAAFPPAPELDPIWARAAWRGQVMARLAQRLALDAWGAHSAGLFEECGKAVLFRHAPDHYPSMLRAARDSDCRRRRSASTNNGRIATITRSKQPWNSTRHGAPECSTLSRHVSARSSVERFVIPTSAPSKLMSRSTAATTRSSAGSP
jgi:hypothetical protein